MKKDYLLLALGNLKHRGLRSWLTILGIFIGIAAVVALISLGQGLENGIEKQFESLGKDKIIISPAGAYSGSESSESLKLTSKDVEIIEEVRGVEWVMGYLTKTGQVKFKGESGIGFIVGADSEDYEESLRIQGIKIIDGKIPREDAKTKVAVGYNHCIDGKIWERGITVGDKIEIDGQEFKVSGIMGKTGGNDDNMIVFNKETLKEILNIEDEESQIIVKVTDGENVKDVSEEIERKLRDFRNEKEGEETFSISTSEQLVDSFKDIMGIVQAVLVGIALISLFVGGIGIMNTMYTSVMERTKEIGIMKAIGAKNSDVLYIFLFESGFLGLVGGIIGVTLGIIIGKSVEYIAGQALGSDLLQASISATLIFGALAFSFLIGTLSGILPAMRAAKLRPVDALRQE